MTTPIQYVGAKPVFRDTLFGTGLEWEPGQTHGVPAEVARHMLRFPTFVEGSADAADQVADIPPKDPLEAEERDEPLVHLETLTKADLLQYAHRHFGVELDGAMKKADLIDAVRRQMGKRVI